MCNLNLSNCSHNQGNQHDGTQHSLQCTEQLSNANWHGTWPARSSSFASRSLATTACAQCIAGCSQGITGSDASDHDANQQQQQQQQSRRRLSRMGTTTEWPALTEASAFERYLSAKRSVRSSDKSPKSLSTCSPACGGRPTVRLKSSFGRSLHCSVTMASNMQTAK